MPDTHTGIAPPNVFPTEEIKSYKMCLALLCCTVCDGAGPALLASGKVGTAWEVFSATGSGPQSTQGPGTHGVCTHSPSKEGTATRLLPLQGRGHFPPPNPQWETPQAGQKLCAYSLGIYCTYLQNT